MECDIEISLLKPPQWEKHSSSSVPVQINIGREFTGFLVFLKEKGGSGVFWKCISTAVAHTSNEQILPSSYEEVNSLTWDGYCHANLTCDGKLMANYFHQTCRLTYTGQDDRITICESEVFYDKVSGRYENEAAHKPYRHLKNDPRLGDTNTLLSVEFASSQLAMVTLKVGHPPFLWTDLLTVGRIFDDGKTQWWIIHKSSDSEPHTFS